MYSAHKNHMETTYEMFSPEMPTTLIGEDFLIFFVLTTTTCRPIQMPWTQHI